MITAIEPIPSERVWIARLLQAASAAPTEESGEGTRKEDQLSIDERCLP